MDENKPRLGHEPSDVNVWAVGKFGIALILIIISSLALLLGLFKYFETRQGAVAAGTDPRAIFPEPRLEEKPALDLKAIRDEEDQRLNSYGWVDPQKGVVRIPIARAIDLLAQRGLAATTSRQGAGN
jgi:hypothetical protein